MEKTLKEIRQEYKLTQIEAAKIANISLRSYKEYENNPNKNQSFKYRYLIDTLNKKFYIDEEHGILTIEQIKERIKPVLDKYDVKFCILFGSYARKEAWDMSDIDLLVDTTVDGINFFGLIEDIRITLCKKIDLLKLNSLINNEELLRNILIDGIKIYERK